MQYLVAMLGVEDQKVVRKKQDPDRNEWRGWEGPFSTIDLESAKQVLCTWQEEQQMMVQKRLHMCKLFEKPDILQISGINCNNDGKCFRDFQSNSYLKRV